MQCLTVPYTHIPFDQPKNCDFDKPREVAPNYSRQKKISAHFQKSDFFPAVRFDHSPEVNVRTKKIHFPRKAPSNVFAANEDAPSLCICETVLMHFDAVRVCVRVCVYFDDVCVCVHV